MKKRFFGPITEAGLVLELVDECARELFGVVGADRLLPFGWTSTGPLNADKTPYIPGDYLHETFPISVGADPAYADGSGTNVVRYEIPLTGFTTRNVTVTATLYYQSIPPYFLNDRFSQAPNSPATQRLYYLTSNLQTKGTPIEDWKFKVATTSEVPKN